MDKNRWETKHVVSVPVICRKQSLPKKRLPPDDLYLRCLVNSDL